MFQTHRKSEVIFFRQQSLTRAPSQKHGAAAAGVPGVDVPESPSAGAARQDRDQTRPALLGPAGSGTGAGHGGRACGWALQGPPWAAAAPDPRGGTGSAMSGVPAPRPLTAPRGGASTARLPPLPAAAAAAVAVAAAAGLAGSGGRALAMAGSGARLRCGRPPSLLLLTWLCAPLLGQPAASHAGKAVRGGCGGEGRRGRGEE